jgi:hypothetical protein
MGAPEAIGAPEVPEPLKGPAAFLEALAGCGNITRACELAGVVRMTMYRLRERDEGFREAWTQAAKLGAEGLEDEARRRAYEGWDEPVHFQGKATSVVRKYSDVLLIFLLKGAMPEKYKDRVEQQHNLSDTRELTQTERTARVASILELARRRESGQGTAAAPVAPPAGPADGSVPQ